MDEEEMKIKMDDGVNTLLVGRELTCLLRDAQWDVSENQNDTVVSSVTL